MIRIHKDIKNIAVWPDELQTYLNDGWTMGLSDDYKQKISDNHAKPFLGVKLSEETKKKMSDSQQNTMYVYNENGMKRIFKNELEKYLNDGWAMGNGRYNDKNGMFDKIIINDGKNDKTIHKSELNKFIKIGWEQGSIKHSGKNNNSFNKIWINKNNKNKMICKTKIFKYIDNGWEEGMTQKGENNPLYGQKRKFIHHPEHSKMKRVLIEELDDYIKRGWIIGYKKY